MTVELSVTSLTCEGCEDVVERAVEEVDGVEEATADRHEDHVTVEGEADIDDLIEAVDMAGYQASKA